ncbi:hypothetical protein CMO96_05025, partial [Candidatus Woesebacteria bacterium]|nr:hypothetical protein [Candidatus Woesebacteria bacterium]
DRERVRELEMEVAELKTRGGQQQVVYGQGVDEEARREIADIWRVLKEVETQQKDVNELRFKVDNIILENSGGSYIPDGVR